MRINEAREDKLSGRIDLFSTRRDIQVLADCCDRSVRDVNIAAEACIRCDDLAVLDQERHASECECPDLPGTFSLLPSRQSRPAGPLRSRPMWSRAGKEEARPFRCTSPPGTRYSRAGSQRNLPLEQAVEDGCRLRSLFRFPERYRNGA